MPFTVGQFLDVFAAYNSALWPVALLLWLASIAVVIQLIRLGSRASVAVNVLLAVHWAWAGLAYHLAFFREINPAAALFGLFFLIQAGFFAWTGVFQRKLEYRTTRSIWSRLGIGLIAYALLYPFIGLVFGLYYPRMPTFGVPCPTTILTAGALLLLPGREFRMVAAIPLAWSVIGGSAVFILGIYADSMLLVAGILLLVRFVRTTRVFWSNTSRQPPASRANVSETSASLGPAAGGTGAMHATETSIANKMTKRISTGSRVWRLDYLSRLQESTAREPLPMFRCPLQPFPSFQAALR